MGGTSGGRLERPKEGMQAVFIRELTCLPYVMQSSSYWRERGRGDGGGESAGSNGYSAATCTC